MSRLAWGTLAFNLLVIVWGAFVRASGSGAGCGSHWPLCNGEVIPQTGLLTTAIEFTHRITSGGCLVLAVAIAWLGVRDHGRGSAVRRGSLAVLGFTLAEALIGAGLVLLRYVEKDQSVGRVVSIALHLSNTFLLLASLALTAWWSAYPPSPRGEYRLARDAGPPRRLRLAAWGALGVTVLLGMTGAITALGDTLFKSTSLAQGIQQDFSPASHFLLKLRVIHPGLAFVTAAGLYLFAELAAGSVRHRHAPRLASALKGLVFLQLAVGMTNLLLLAPTGLQLVHLFIAESLWVALVLLAALALQAPEEPVHGAL